MYPAAASAYDRAITVFSPDGRLFQVEYAREAVRRGATSIGLIYDAGVLLAAEKTLESPLIKLQSMQKIFKVDDHLGIATSGLVADARRLVDYGRYIAQREKMIYKRPIDTEYLTKSICDLVQEYTQFGGTRPFGAALLVAGVDGEGKHLFKTDPSGGFYETYACAIGSGESEVEAFLEKKYKEKLPYDSALELILNCLYLKNKQLSGDNVDIAVIDEKTKKITFLEKNTLDKEIQKLRKK
ncbi:MAG: archaeal proteasome endopeptidase complex subunit alpha [archaeon]